MVNENKNAQQWLDEKYPKNGTCQRNSDLENKNKTRRGITHLNIRKGKVGNGIFNRNKNLIEDLRLEGFTNLRILIVSSHELIGLDVSDCPNLEELDCHGNEITNLNVNGCSCLRKINCSNNYIRELDLSTCVNLEEVNINDCSNLTVDKVKSHLVYDAESGKLVRSSLKVRGGPQIIPAGENDIRNILIIGITGNGKSALANVLSGVPDNKFEEKSSSTSVTKNFQVSEVFEWQNKKYRVIDNIGFGDTASLSKEDILFKVGEGIYSAKEGINQVFFVFKGRFSPEQIEAFNLFKDFIAESRITEFTTMIRTNFENFQNQEKCEKDSNDLLSQTKELSEIINSSNRVIHVDNPAIPVIKEKDNERTRTRKKERALANEESRRASRERVLNNLADNCLEIYKLKEWDSIHDQVSRYIEQIAEKERELTKAGSDSEKNRLQDEIKENKGKIADEVNAKLTTEISSFSKLIAQIEAKSINVAHFFSFHKE